MNLYVDWDNFLQSCSLNDFLDVPFWVSEYLRDEEPRLSEPFVKELERICRERGLAYWVDENGTVHPFVDIEFERLSSELIADLSAPRCSSVRSHVEAAERAMLRSSTEHRLAMRSVFDAVENLFKLIDPKSKQLNNSAIQNKLKPLVLAIYEDGSVEARLASKNVDVLKAWVEGLHNYRYADGSEEPKQPSEGSMILAVSVGYSLLRWLIEIDASRVR